MNTVRLNLASMRERVARLARDPKVSDNAQHVYRQMELFGLPKLADEGRVTMTVEEWDALFTVTAGQPQLVASA